VSALVEQVCGVRLVSQQIVALLCSGSGRFAPLRLTRPRALIEGVDRTPGRKGVDEQLVGCLLGQATSG
jgi:hypothetical protein